jgi:uncharacterized protein YpmB
MTMTRRIVWFGLFALVTIVILLTRFYYGVQNDHWQERKQAKAAAAAQAGIVRVDSVQTFNGADEYNVVTGTNAQGEKLIVWLGTQETHVEKASAGITAEQATAALLKRSPGVEVERVVPGKLRSDYVWELFYRRQEDGGERYLYDYVKFSDGTYIDTYRLSLQ